MSGAVRIPPKCKRPRSTSEGPFGGKKIRLGKVPPEKKGGEERSTQGTKRAKGIIPSNPMAQHLAKAIVLCRPRRGEVSQREDEGGPRKPGMMKKRAA